MRSRFNIKALIVCIAIPLAVGLVASFLSRSGIEANALVIKPPLAPPAWLFPIVWTILYILMGISSYLVVTTSHNPEQLEKYIFFYGSQLAINFIWSLIFFNMQWYFIAFILIIILWYLIICTIKAAEAINRLAAYLLIPYLLWVTFAAYLTLGIWILN